MNITRLKPGGQKCASIRARRLKVRVFGLLLISSASVAEVYQQPREFLADTFGNAIPTAERLWVTGELKAEIRAILGRDLGQLRVRYWRDKTRTAWILEEIGKEQPITTGFVVDAHKLTDVRVLIYRESRGWEVRYPAFTEQFNGAGLTDQFLLDRHIDGISGATLSVNALIRLARLALVLHRHADS